MAEREHPVQMNTGCLRFRALASDESGPLSFAIAWTRTDRPDGLYVVSRMRINDTDEGTPDPLVSPFTQVTTAWRRLM